MPHLTKQAAEQRTPRSRDFSIENAVKHIALTNKRRKAGGVYVPDDELRELLVEAYPFALKKATIEAFEGALIDSSWMRR